MEISKLEDNGNVIKEVSSSVSSSSSQFEKDIGSSHVIQKSSSLESEEVSKMVSQSPLDTIDSEITDETKDSGEIQQDNLKSALQEIISEIEESITGREEHSLLQEKEECKTKQEEELPLSGHQEELVENVLEECKSQAHKERFLKIDRQTSTTSLEELQQDSNAASLLSLLSRDVGKRPHSLPANLAHLWQSLKIANELNQSLAEANSSINGDDSETLNTYTTIDNIC